MNLNSFILLIFLYFGVGRASSFVLLSFSLNLKDMMSVYSIIYPIKMALSSGTLLFMAPIFFVLCKNWDRLLFAFVLLFFYYYLMIVLILSIFVI